ncbi:SPOR domain-containing protein [Variovorax terrae]|uniref:SPOR domain-containing protein n=1 Tax=Variovorax terrae TaxID=2923278 RepID=A0A9X1W1I4_9BURK|nr:SPOR domain-containing protein [Variovorax terrae]MCJ0766037.1 SPOR domain-containing protein [Variovorax terrae]
MKHQRGGTFIGLVIGIVIGLGAALAVAVYVTKVPVPFVNKGQTRSAEQDAAEAKKNKDWDPNTPLYGKNPVRPPAPAASGAVGVAPPVAPVAPAASAARPAVAAVPAGRSEGKPASADPLGDLAQARAAAAGGGADPFTYFVQAGAYRTAEDAEAQRAKLSLIGVESKVTEREQSGRTVFRVRVGPFDKKEDADKTKEKLDGGGMETALVRVQR